MLAFHWWKSCGALIGETPVSKASKDVMAPTEHKGGVCVSRINPLVGKHTDVTTSINATLELCAGVSPKHQTQHDSKICHQPGQTATGKIYMS